MSDEDPTDAESLGRFARIERRGDRLIHSKHMLWQIGLASFLEALIVPIPLETILLPLLQARRKQMLLIATVVLITCLLAALVGYGVGRFLFDAIGPQLVELVASPEQFESVRQQMIERGFWFVFSIGVVPIPFQIAMLTAGFTEYPLHLFLLASALSRGIRYYGLVLLVLLFGNRAQKLYERHKKTVAVGFLVIVTAAWAYAIFG